MNAQAFLLHNLGKLCLLSHEKTEICWTPCFHSEEDGFLGKQSNRISVGETNSEVQSYSSR